jgi:hypothetical protein
MGATLLAMSALGATSVQAQTVNVPATASIWLAGQPSGVSVSGYFGTDTAPDESPVELQVTGSTVTFLAAGSYSIDGSCFNATAAGGCYPQEGALSPAPWSNDYTGPDALVGIFVGATPTIGSASGYQGPLNYVSGPDYTNAANIGPGTYSPALNQIFYIGTGAGEVFNTPTGATAVDLGILDSIGANTNNVGSLTVSFTGATSAAPEPSSWILMLLGVGGLGAMMRWRRKAGLTVAAI